MKFRQHTTNMFAHSFLILLGLVVATSFLTSCANARSLPPRILSGYNGFWLDSGSITDCVDRYLEPMRAAGFTACDFKIHPSNFDLKDPQQFNRLKELAQAIDSRGMLFLTYVFPHPYDGRRDPVAHAELPAFVREDGSVVEEKFSLVHWATWRRLFDNTFQLAQASLKLPIAAVRIDIETIQNVGISYDDQAWDCFTAEHNIALDVPAADRVSFLKKKQLFNAYNQWFFRQLDIIAQRLERELHAINPDLMLGYMPSVAGSFKDPFTRHLATERAPAIIDNWTMYNGEGFNQAVLDEQARVKAMNPNNLSIPWLRINSYCPEDIAVQAYHAGFTTDGYSNWDMFMLRAEYQTAPNSHRLPAPYTPVEYYDAYRLANEQLLADLKDGKTQPTGIPFKPATPLSAPLRIDDITVPQLQPAGNGTGEPRWFVLRNRRVIYIHAQAGEDIKVDLRHLAGDSRRIALQYAVIDADHNKLRNESIMPGDTESFTCTAPKTATYALIVTGGIDGLAWYGVRVHNQHMGVLAEPQTYFFYTEDFDVWVSRSHPTKPARVKARTDIDIEIFKVRFNRDKATETSVTSEITFDLPVDQEVSVLHLGKPIKIPQGLYTQDIYVTVEGAAEPYLADGPQRRLVTPPKQ